MGTLLADAPEKEIEEAFKKRCKFSIYFDTPLRYGRYAMLLSDARMKELMIETVKEMQETHDLELDADPAKLDGGQLEILDESEHDFDERTRYSQEYTGLGTRLPHETL